MGSPVRPWIGIAAAALLVVTSAAAVYAQAEEPSDPEAAEVSEPAGEAGEPAAELAICPMPELGETAGSAEPTLDPDTEPGSDGCVAPQMEMEDPLGGAPHMRFYVNDLGGDGGVDVVRTSWVAYTMAGPQAEAARSNDDIVVAGQRNKVLKAGQGTLIGVELAAPLQPGDGVHVGTDVKDDATKRAPSAVSAPDNAFANVREVMSFILRDDGTPFAGASDLSKAFDYAAKHPFAAWQDGSNVYFFVPDGGLGRDFRVVAVGQRPAAAASPASAVAGEREVMTFVRASGGAPPARASDPDFRLVAAETSVTQDTVGLGAAPGLLATNGTLGWLAECIDQLLDHTPLEIEGVVSYSNTEVGYCFRANARDLAVIDAYVKRQGDTSFGAADIGFSLREEGKDERQTLPALIAAYEGRIYIVFPTPLKAYGFHALTDVKFEPTGDAEVDRVLGRAAEAIGRNTNPTVVDANAGYLQGMDCLAGVPDFTPPW